MFILNHLHSMCFFHLRLLGSIRRLCHSEVDSGSDWTTGCLWCSLHAYHCEQAAASLYVGLLPFPNWLHLFGLLSQFIKHDCPLCTAEAVWVDKDTGWLVLTLDAYLLKTSLDLHSSRSGIFNPCTPLCFCVLRPSSAQWLLLFV